MDAKELQEEEIEALQSIFASEFKMHKTWDGTFRFEIAVNPTPSDSGKMHVACNMEVIFTKDYPVKSAPVITLTATKGLEKDQLTDITKNVKALCIDRIGDSMIYEVYDTVKDFLEANNHQPLSYHEQMQAKQQAEEDRRHAAREAALALEESASKAEALELQRQIDATLAQKKEQKKLEVPSKLARKSSSNDKHQEVAEKAARDVAKEDKAKKDKKKKKHKHRDRAESMDSEAPNADEEFAADLAKHMNAYAAPKQDMFGFDFGDDANFGFDEPEEEQGEISEEWSEEDEESEFEEEELEESSELQNSTNGPPTQTVSRFISDFEELGPLGRGGFGEVVKVRNKLDGLLYAVKQIKLENDPAMYKKIIREVSTIAMLQHRYIVRYFQAWIEDGATREMTLEEEDDGFSSEEDDWLHNTTFSSLRRKKSESSPDENPRYLYIQMEFCTHKNLKSLIDDGMHPDAAWRLFRQMLEAMSFIHKKGIIHRDIKPPNVFIDSKSNIKLGDFGLAVLGSEGTLEHKKSDEAAMSTLIPDMGELAEVVGTPFYRSPEQETEGVEYGFEADMYALGIILFEMFHRFDSGSERVIVLGELRKTGKIPKGTLEVEQPPPPSSPQRNFSPPAELSKDEKLREDEIKVAREASLPNVRKIIEWLLQSNPSDRPSADELLKSGLVPLKIEDEYMELALTTITRPESSFHTRLLDILFDSPATDVVDFTYDYIGNKHKTAEDAHLSHSHVYNSFRTRIFSKVTEQFKNHGGVHIKTPVFIPQTSKVQIEKACTAMDQSGVLMQLPYTLTVPFVRYVVQHRPEDDSEWTGNTVLSTAEHESSRKMKLDLRRYDIGKVYRKNPHGGRPRELWECDFDIVWPSSAKGLKPFASPNLTNERKLAPNLKKPTILMSELIAITAGIMHLFQDALGTCTVRITHFGLLNACLRRITLSAARNAKPKSVMKFCLDLEQKVRTLMASSLPLATSHRWARSNLKESLENDCGFSPQMIADVSMICGLFTGEGSFTVEECLARLRSYLIRDDSQMSRSLSPFLTPLEDIEGGLAELRNLIKFLGVLKVKCKFMIDLGFVAGPTSVFTNGLAFQFFSHQDGMHRRADILAIGGRYDELLQKLSPPSRRNAPLSGMGVNIAIEKIVHGVFAQQFVSSGKKKAKSIALKPQMYGHGCLLYAERGARVEERMAVATILWQKGIRAEFMYPRCLSFDGLKNYCNEWKIKWVFRFKARGSNTKNRSVIAYNMLTSTGLKRHESKERSDGVDVDVDDIPQFLRHQTFSKKTETVDPNSSSAKDSLTNNSIEFKITVLDAQNSLSAHKKYNAEKSCQETLRASGMLRSNGNFAVVVVELPIIVIRKLSLAVLEMGVQQDTKILSAVSAQGSKKVVCAVLLEWIQRQFKKKEQMMVLYSHLDKRFDLLDLRNT